MKDELTNESVDGVVNSPNDDQTLEAKEDKEVVDVPQDEAKEEPVLELLHAPVEEEAEEKIELLHSPVEDKTEDTTIELLHSPSVSDDAKADEPKDKKEDKPLDQDVKKNKIFEPFKIKDIVFLAIMSACMLIGGAVMPLAIHIPVFGIIHLMLGLQMSLLPVIGLLKVRKTGSLFFMCLFFGIFIAFIQPVMFVGVVVCALLTELLTIAIFRGYKKEAACVFATTIFFPMSLPLLCLYYNVMFSGEAGEAVQAMVNPPVGMAIGISIAILALCFVGSIIGAIISRELKKAGALKK